MVHLLAANWIFRCSFYRKNLNLNKIYTKSEQISRVHTKLQSSITPRKNGKSKKSYWILRWTSFLMITLTFLYDEYIDRPKLTEQKKPIWVYSSCPPQVGSEQQIYSYSYVNLASNYFTCCKIFSESTISANLATKKVFLE